MTNRPTQSFRGSRFSAKGRQALEAIGDALKRRVIDFRMASDLSDKVKAGNVDEVMRLLEPSNT